MNKVLIIVSCFIVVLSGGSLYSQSASSNDVEKYEIDAENFLGMFDGIYSDALIDEISYKLPDEVSIINYGIGDFSNDGYLDLAISYRDKSCAQKTYKVVLLVNEDNRTFNNVLEFKAKWHDTPFDIGFSIRKSLITVSYRVNINWMFSSYTYQGDKLNKIRDEMY